MLRVTSCILYTFAFILVCTLAAESNSTESTSLASDATSASIDSSSSISTEANSEITSTISPSSSTGVEAVESSTDNSASLKPSTISSLITSTVEEASTASTSRPTTTGSTTIAPSTTTTTARATTTTTTSRRTTSISTTELPVEETTEIELTGVCYVKAWGSVAICRTNFVNRVEGKDDAGKCCLYNLLTECAHIGARKLCGEYTEYATAKWLQKYHKMIDYLDCSNVDTNSFSCFWISWENYVSVLLFLIVTIIMLVYVARWYYRGGIGKV